MRVSFAFTIVLGVVLACCGCQPAALVAPDKQPASGESGHETPVSTVASSQGGVAIINLSEIARQLGESQRWQAELSERETELNERLELMKMSFEKELEEAKSAMGDEPTAAQEGEIKQLSARYNTSILQEREHARQEYGQFQAALETEFRNKVKPKALEVAQANGFSVVMQHNAVFEFAGNADITVAVIEQLQGSAEFANTTKPSKDRVGRKLPGGGQFRPAQ